MSSPKRRSEEPLVKLKVVTPVKDKEFKDEEDKDIGDREDKDKEDEMEKDKEDEVEKDEDDDEVYEVETILDYAYDKESVRNIFISCLSLLIY